MTEGTPDARGRRIANALIFQGAWFALVFAAEAKLLWPGLIAAAVAAVVALALDRRRGRGLLVLGVAVWIGLLVDGLNMSRDWLRTAFGGAGSVASWIFMAALWTAFGTTIRSSLAVLAGRPLLAAFLGAVGAPLAYRAGAALGAIELAGPALPVIAIEWAIVLPLLLGLGRDDGDGR